MFHGPAEFEITDPDGYAVCLSQLLEDASDLPSPAAWRPFAAAIWLAGLASAFGCLVRFCFAPCLLVAQRLRPQ